MGLNYFNIDFADISKEKTFRLDVKFHNVYTHTIREKNAFPLFKFLRVGCKNSVLDKEIINGINYVEIGNVDNYGNIKPIELEGQEIDPHEKVRLYKKIENGDIFKPEENSLLITSVRPNLKKFINISEKESNYYFTTAFIYLLKNNELIPPKIFLYLFRTILYERLIGLCRIGKGYPTLKDEDLKFFYIEDKVINDIILNKDKILTKIEDDERKIECLKTRLEILQDIIDEIFIKYKIKNNPYKYSIEDEFILNIDKIGSNKYLRLGSRYYSFLENHHCLLFEQDCFFENVQLRKIIKRINTPVLKDRILDKVYFLIDLEQIESKTGRLIDKNNEVTEIGSDKVIFGDSDLIISKLRPYLAYILINPKDRDYIGTTELIPFRLFNPELDINYLKYCLLSYEFINKSKLMMYGKEHPRINIFDLLSIKIPKPEFKIQNNIASEIIERDNNNLNIINEIENLRLGIENFIKNNIKL